jgi:thiamine biosynthesis protein ThiI
MALISGGFDSAVAAWSVMRPGLAVDFVFCNLSGAAYEPQVLQVAEVLCELRATGMRPRLWVVDLNAAVSDLRAHVTPRFWQVVLKRLMYRVASGVAGAAKAQALVTVESIGQVSSQTLSNLAAIEPVAGRLVLRPLIAAEKREIMERAREIGTAPLSERIPEFCALTVQLPAVRSSSEAIDAEEVRLDASLVDRAVAEAHRVELAELTPDELRTDYLFVSEPPEGAEVIDLRPPRLFAKGHPPGAVHRAPEEVMARLDRMDKRRPYVLDCSFGTVSAHLAEVMQQFGYQAYALRRHPAPREPEALEVP